MLPRFAIQQPTGAPRAAVLVAHGLNLHPDRMQPICNLLLEAGAIVVRMALRGHRGVYDRLARVRRNDWLEDFAAAFDTLAEQAGRPTGESPQLKPGRSRTRGRRTGTSAPLPTGFLGQSLGALAFCDYLCAGHRDSAPGVTGYPASQALLISPALALRPRVHILRPLIATHRRLPIPSASDPADRLYDRLPAGAYRALFASYATFRRSLRAAPLRLPCRIVVNEGDEIVSSRGISRLVDLGALPDARLLVFERDTAGRGARHLAVDPETMGADNWRRFDEEARRFVDSVAASRI